MKFEIELTDGQVAQLHTIASTRTNKSHTQLMNQVVERGLYTLVQRSRYNAERYADAKVEREAFKEWKATLARE
jgi:hypothetical protein